jgi:hypothetical protein
MIVADDARLAAKLACVYSQPGCYLPITDAPRMGRPDSHHEVIRRTNAMARTKARGVILAGLGADARQALEKAVPPSMRISLSDEMHLDRLVPELSLSRTRAATSEPLRWGRDHIGIGVLRALYEGRLIEFEDRPSLDEAVPSRSGHLVVCEAGEDLSEVIAAQYAFALQGGLKIIPAIPEEFARASLESLHALYTSGDPQGAMNAVRQAFRHICDPLAIPEGGSLTFISRHLPLGVAFPEVPSTHLFTYPDLGLAVINGFAAEQAGTPGVNVAVLIDPETTEAAEIDAVATELAARGTFVRVHAGPGAAVAEVSDTVELFPYDLLVFATHCGDAAGFRWTYESRDSDGIDRTLVVDIAVGVGRTDEPDRLAVTEFIRFHSLDGVEWNDPHKSEKLYVGTAIHDFIRMQRNKAIEPCERTTIGRVIGSSAMKMYDNNYLPLPRTLADKETPIVINNACVSWHELAGRFMFANARAYVGTLVDVNSLEAQEVIPRIVGKHYGKHLPHAVRAAQRDVYAESDRRPYVTSGVYTQSLRARRQDTPAIVTKKLEAAAAEWAEAVAAQRAEGEMSAEKRTESVARYYEREAARFRKRWGD